MLFFTGFSRTASSIAAEQIKETRNKKPELAQMHRMVDEAVNILNGDNDLSDFGRLLHETWQIKRSLTNKVSTPYIDFVYERAMEAGATGGKLLGAGGGGFILLFVEPEFQSKVKESLSHLLQVPFCFENRGSQIIFYEPDLTYESDRQEVKDRGAYAKRENS